MYIPKKNLGDFFQEIIKNCSVSRKDRISRGMAYRNLFLTGDEGGTPQFWNKVNPHVEQLCSYLYSPVELRFAVESYGTISAVDDAKNRVAASHMHKRMRQSNVDISISEAVKWSLVKGKTFVKLLWSDDGFDPYLVQPEMMGVLREDLESLDRQEAFYHSTWYTPERFAQLIAYHEDRDEIMNKVKRNLDPSKAKNDADSNANERQIILGGMYPFQVAGQNNPQQSRGVANWMNAPAPTLAPEVASTLIRLDELWLWDEQRDDWTTLQGVDDIIIYGKDQHRNIFADMFDPDNEERSPKTDNDNPLSGKHPFVEFCPNTLSGYFWGRSELEDVKLLQKSINVRKDGINALLRRQEDPPRYFSGGSGVTQQAYSKLKKPGGYMVDSNPNAKIQTLAPELPATLFDSLHEDEREFDAAAGFAPVMTGHGESGVRAQGHAETLVRTASPRFKDRALLVERQVEEIGGLALDMLKAKDATKLVAWVTQQEAGIEVSKEEADVEMPPVSSMMPVTFLFGQLPKNCKVVVDSHSSSPAFSADTQSLLFNLFKAGAIKPERLVEHTHPPGEDELIDDLKKAEIQKAEYQAQHPEEAAEQSKKKKKK